MKDSWVNFKDLGSFKGLGAGWRGGGILDQDVIHYDTGGEGAPREHIDFGPHSSDPPHTSDRKEVSRRTRRISVLGSESGDSSGRCMAHFQSYGGATRNNDFCPRSLDQMRTIRLMPKSLTTLCLQVNSLELNSLILLIFIT